MIVDDAHALHEGVDRRRADEAPAAFLQILRQRGRLRPSWAWPATSPNRAVSAASSGPARSARQRRRATPPPSASSTARRALLIVDSILPRWRTMPASPSSRSTSLSPKRAILREVEAGEGVAEILALAEDRQPRQAGLEALEADLLEQPEIVGDRPPPFAIVIDRVVRRARHPRRSAPCRPRRQSGLRSPPSGPPVTQSVTSHESVRDRKPSPERLLTARWQYFINHKFGRSAGICAPARSCSPFGWIWPP